MTGVKKMEGVQGLYPYDLARQSHFYRITHSDAALLCFDPSSVSDVRWVARSEAVGQKVSDELLLFGSYRRAMNGKASDTCTSQLLIMNMPSSSITA